MIENAMVVDWWWGEAEYGVPLENHEESEEESEEEYNDRD